jgi:formate dehydrogenase iron-sulfur subunit
MKAILTDVSKCVGCQKCVAACNAEHGQPPVAAPQRWTLDDGLSADRLTSVVRRDGRDVRKQCRHCLEPACASACPVGALHRTPEGPVVYDASRCLGCRYCMMACPYGIPRYAWGSATPTVRKCDLCFARRTSQGRQPACTEACPTKATIFGERDQLFAEARRRVAANRAEYLPRVWGEGEAGGASVLYVSPIPLDFLRVGGRPLNRPLPALTEPAMAAVPPLFVATGAVMGTLAWIIGRRTRLSAAAAVKAEPERDRAAPPGEGKP